jgi:hypothetical protein
VNGQPNPDSYRMALDATTADLDQITAQIEQLHQRREHLQKAKEALRIIVALKDGVVPAAADTEAGIRPVQEIDSHRAPSEPLFGNGFPAAADYNDMFERPANGVRAAAALA